MLETGPGAAGLGVQGWGLPVAPAASTQPEPAQPGFCLVLMHVWGGLTMTCCHLQAAHTHAMLRTAQYHCRAHVRWHLSWQAWATWPLPSTKGFLLDTLFSVNAWGSRHLARAARPLAASSQSQAWHLVGKWELGSLEGALGVWTLWAPGVVGSHI